MTVTEFILARITEDAADANDVHNRSSDRWMDGDCVCDWPARVLRECAAKRSILARHKPVPDRGRYSEDEDRFDEPVDDYERTHPVCAWCRDYTGDHHAAPCPDVLALAAVYVDHPDFDPSWLLH